MNDARRLMFAAAALTTLTRVASAQPGVPFRETWKFEAEETVFRAPRALGIAGDCEVWIADVLAGVYRIPCAGGPPLHVASVGRVEKDLQLPWILSRAGGDTIAVLDRDAQRIRFFTVGGRSAGARDLRLPEALTGDVVGLSTVGGMRIWLHQFPNATDPGSLSSLLLAVRPGDSARDTLAVFDGLPSIYWGSGFGGSRIPPPNQRRPLVAFTTSGGFVSGRNDSSVVTVHDSTGAVVREFHLEFVSGSSVSGSDRDAYADSVRRSTDADMRELHYETAERRKYQAQVATYLREDVVFPPQRQLYDHFVVDAAGAALWVQRAGTGRSYTRTWEVYSLESGLLLRRVTVPHKGAVASAAVHNGAIYAVERPLNGRSRIARYAQQ